MLKKNVKKLLALGLAAGMVLGMTACGGEKAAEDTTAAQTEAAEDGKKVMNIARNFDEDIALKKLDDLEKNIYLLEDNPYLGITPRYPALKDKAIRC